MNNARQHAEDYLRDAVSFIGAAFNLARSRPWSFDIAVQQRAGGLLRELVDLFHDNQLTAASQPVSPRRSDPAFAAFMYELTLQAKDGSFVGRRGRGNRRKDHGGSTRHT